MPKLPVPLTEFFPLSELPDHLPKRRGKKLDRSIGYRWSTAGCRGVQLETLDMAGTLHTCMPWLLEFLSAVQKLKGA